MLPEVLLRPLQRPQGLLIVRGVSNPTAISKFSIKLSCPFSYRQSFSINFRFLSVFHGRFSCLTESCGPRVLPEVLDRPPQRPQASLGLRGRLLIVRGVSNSTAISEFSTSKFFFLVEKSGRFNRFLDHYLCFTDSSCLQWCLFDHQNSLMYLLGFLDERGRLLMSVES